MLSSEVKQLVIATGAEIIGPVSTADAARDILAFEEIDAVIIDIEIPTGEVIAVIDDLITESIPFVFVTAKTPFSNSSRYAGFVLSGNAEQLGDIATALFAPRNFDH